VPPESGGSGSGTASNSGSEGSGDDSSSSSSGSEPHKGKRVWLYLLVAAFVTVSVVAGALFYRRYRRSRTGSSREEGYIALTIQLMLLTLTEYARVQDELPELDDSLTL